MDLRSAVHCAFNLRDVSKNRHLWRHFLASLFVWSVGLQFLFMGLFEKKCFRHIQQTDSLKLRISEERNAMLPVMSAASVV
jgi:hypothetical protein